MSDDQVRREVYRAFLETGGAPTARDVAARLALEEQTVLAAFRRLHEARAIVLHPGSTDIWMANPFSAVPTTFQVTATGRKWWGNCIWDSLGVISMVGGSGEVSTACPDCAEPMELAVNDYQLAPAGGLIHFAVAARNWWDDIGYT